MSATYGRRPDRAAAGEPKEFPFRVGVILAREEYELLVMVKKTLSPLRPELVSHVEGIRTALELAAKWIEHEDGLRLETNK